METHFQFPHFQFLHFQFLHFQFLHFLCLLYLYIEDVENVIICYNTFFKISSAKVAFLMSKRKSCWHYWAQAISAPFSEKTHFPFTQHSNCVSDVWVCVSVSHMCTVFWKVTFLCTCHERYACVCECVSVSDMCVCVSVWGIRALISTKTRFRAHITHIFSFFLNDMCVWESVRRMCTVRHQNPFLVPAYTHHPSPRHSHGRIMGEKKIPNKKLKIKN